MRNVLTVLLILSVTILSFAATGTVVPDGDNAEGNWSTAPLFSKVDDDVDADDGVEIDSPNNPAPTGDDVVFDVTCPATLGDVTEANLRILLSENALGKNASCNVTWSATSATDIATGLLFGSQTAYASGNQTGLSINKSTCDASTLTVSCTQGGSGAPAIVHMEAFNLDIVFSEPRTRRTIIISKACNNK